MSMQRVMLIPFFLCFLVMLSCPARAAEGAEPGGLDAPMDGVILEDPDPDPGYSVDAPSEVPPGDLGSDPDPGYSVDVPSEVPPGDLGSDPDPGYSVDVPSEVPPGDLGGDIDPGYSVDTPGGDLLGDMPLDGIVLPEETVDNAAVVEALASTNMLLSYIFVIGLYFFVVSVGKLIYSFFNFF